MSDDAETKALENQNKICSALFDNEKTQGKVNRETMEEVAETT